MEFCPLDQPNISDVITAQNLLGGKVVKLPYQKSKSGMSFIIDTDTMLRTHIGIPTSSILNRFALPTKMNLTNDTKNIKMWTVKNDEYRACKHADTQCIKYFEVIFGPDMAITKQTVVAYPPYFNKLQAITYLTTKLSNFLSKNAAATTYTQKIISIPCVPTELGLTIYFNQLAELKRRLHNLELMKINCTLLTIHDFNIFHQLPIPNTDIHYIVTKWATQIQMHKYNNDNYWVSFITLYTKEIANIYYDGDHAANMANIIAHVTNLNSNHNLTSYNLSTMTTNITTL